MFENQLGSQIEREQKKASEARKKSRRETHTSVRHMNFVGQKVARLSSAFYTSKQNAEFTEADSTWMTQILIGTVTSFELHATPVHDRWFVKWEDSDPCPESVPYKKLVNDIELYKVRCN